MGRADFFDRVKPTVSADEHTPPQQGGHKQHAQPTLSAAEQGGHKGHPYYGRRLLNGHHSPPRLTGRPHIYWLYAIISPYNQAPSIVRAALVPALGMGGRGRSALGRLGWAVLACALLLCLIFPHMSSTAHAASIDSAGRVSGQLLNGSHNNAPVANQSVTLQMAQGNSSRDLVTITTDAQGRYTFGALESDSSVQYAVYTLYQNAQYFTDLIDLSKKANQQVNLTVYDATTSTANLAVVQASILLEKPNPQTGMLSVSEDYFFENLSNTTYVGTVDASHGKPNALSFPLPPDARFLTLATGFNGYTGTQVDTGFASNAAVPPGTSEFSFSFQVPYSGNSYHFTYKTLYPTVALSLLTPTNILTTASDLTSKGPTNTQSGTYQMFQGKTLTANTSIGAQLTGLPVPTKAAPQQQDTLNTGLLWLVALLIVLMILCGIGGYVYTTRRRQAANARQKQVTRKGATSASGKKVATSVTKESLLQELLELDKAYEAGKLKKAAYQEQRARLRNRLRPLMNEQPEKSREAAKQTANGSGKGEQ